MTDYRSLNHTKWECKYHVVFIPKYRKKRIYEGHLMPDHVHMMLSIPPKYSVAQVIGYIKGKSAIHIAREFAGHKSTHNPGSNGRG